MRATERAADADHGAPIGYVPDWSWSPGEEVPLHLLCSQPWTAELVELEHGDPRPGGAGLLETLIHGDGRRHAPAAPVTRPGSMCVAQVQGLPDRYAVAVAACPTTAETRMSVLSALDDHGGVLWRVQLDGTGHLRLCGEDEADAAGDPVAVELGEWLAIGVFADHRTGVVELQLARASGATAAAVVHRARLRGRPAWLGLGGDHGPGAPVADAPRTSFDGRLHGALVASRRLGPAELHALRRGEDPRRVLEAGEALATWRFPAAPSVRVSGAAARCLMRNTPVAGVRGPAGRSDALHCHGDALTDAQWPAATTVAIPPGTRSGVHAIRVTSDAGVDRIPIVVRPRGRGGGGRALLVLPTLTYLAYANERQPGPGTYLEHLEAVSRPGPGDRWLERHSEFGASTYDRYRDGRGIPVSGLRRPIPSLRPDYLHWLSREPRHLGADLYIVHWLRRAGVPFDVACDEDLDRDPERTLRPYDLVLTGSHPEYCTARMLDGLGAQLARGGRLMYLGGNGFYWVTSTSPSSPGVIEVRRGPHGYPWRMDADDSTHMLDGLRGGFWSDNGRAPRDLVGLTFIAQGSESPAPGHRIRGDVPAESAWALGGLRPGLAVGTSGRLMGGSAGHEIDWVDPDLPSAGPVTVLASSGGHAPTLQISSERLARTRDAAGLRPRSDVVLYEPPAGGLVFSVGSICWAGGLAFPGGDPGVRALTETVLRRFLDPASARTRAQAAVSPPSTTSVLPVTNAAPGPTR